MSLSLKNDELRLRRMVIRCVVSVVIDLGRYCSVSVCGDPCWAAADQLRSALERSIVIICGGRLVIGGDYLWWWAGDR